MFLGKLDSNFLEDFSVVSLKGSIESTVTVDNDETELLIVLEKTTQRAGIELISAIVERLIDWAEGLNIIVYFLLGLSVFHQDDAAKDN